MNTSWKPEKWSLRAAGVCAVALVMACNPYDPRVGQFNAGPVDPINFPPENLGVARTASFAARYTAGSGSFRGARAWVAAGRSVDYFRFAVPTPVPAPMGFSPFAIPASAPKAYVFDPTAENAFTNSGCKKPDGWEYDQRRDAIRLDEQGAIFTALPFAVYDPGLAGAAASTMVPVTQLGGTRAYGPIVNVVPVTTMSMPCQATKSEADLNKRGDVSLTQGDPNPATGVRVGVPSGRYVAATIIDPGAPVRDSTSTAMAPSPETGLGLQRWGWFNQFLLAYIEGGDIPVDTTGATPRFRPQRIFIPRTISTPMNPMSATGPGAAGAGYDVIEFARGEAGYSPLCQVITYATPMPMLPDDLPKSATDIVTNYQATFQNGEVFYCLQTQPLPAAPVP